MTVQMFRGRTLEQKRALVSSITDAMVQHAGAKPDALIVIIQETEPENWAMAGRLVADRDAAGGRTGSG